MEILATICFFGNDSNFISCLSTFDGEYVPSVVSGWDPDFISEEIGMLQHREWCYGNEKEMILVKTLV